MKRLSTLLLPLCLILTFTAGAAAGKSVEIRLQDGSRWRGELSDMVKVTYTQQRVHITVTGRLTNVAELFIQLEADIAGQLREKTIFRDDIISIRTLGEESEEADKIEKMKKPEPGDADRTVNVKDANDDDVPRGPDGRALGVFVLPLEGTVGESFRHDEIKMLGERADEYGPGQIIVLIIDSNGGLVIESEKITDTIWDLKKRHRVIAWVKKAISAGCATAMVCDEIYFMTEGTAGSVTTLVGDRSASEEEAKKGIEFLAEIARRAGYSPHIARSMKLKKYICTYDKDPETGEVTFYGDRSGEHMLSDEEHNLTFNSSVALDCGFSKGTADTEEDLAKFLDLPKWHEIDDYGREIAKDWQDLVERCRKNVPELLRDRQLASAARTVEERLGKIIRADEKLIRWIDRCTWPCRLMGLPEKEFFEQEIEQLKKQLADYRRRSGG